jgi:hypothetical protein
MVAYLVFDGTVFQRYFVEILAVFAEPLDVHPFQAIGHQALLGAFKHLQVIMADDRGWGIDQPIEHGGALQQHVRSAEQSVDIVFDQGLVGG